MYNNPLFHNKFLHFRPFLQDVCQTVQCPPGWTLVGQACSPTELLMGVSYQNMDATFIVKAFENDPKPPLHVWVMLTHGFIAYISSFLNVQMQYPENSFGQVGVLCEIQTYLKLRVELSEMFREMSVNGYNILDDNIEYMAVRVPFRMLTKGQNNTEDLLGQLIQLFTVDTTLFGMQVLFQEVNHSNFEDNQQRIEITKPELMDLIFNLTYFPFMELLPWSFNDEQGHGILPISRATNRPCYPSHNIYPTGTCPMVKLPSENIRNLNKSYRHLTVEKSNFGRLTFDTWILSKNHEFVFVCWHDYISQLRLLKADGHNEIEARLNEELSTLTIVCLSFSLVSLAITFLVYCTLPSLRTLPGLNMGLVAVLFLSQLTTLIKFV